MSLMKSSYIKEDQKTFWVHVDGKTLTRCHDEYFSGPRFEHRRCPFCSRITSLHSWHWLSHLKVCAPVFYNTRQLLELRYTALDKINYVDISYIRQ